MILDKLENAQRYFALSEGIKKALEFLQNNDLNSLPAGRHDILDGEVFALVSNYTSKNPDKGKWEAHINYVDVQYVAAGVEKMGFANTENLSVSEEYVPEKDIVFLNGEGSFVEVPQGYFTIFFPEDAHMPGNKIKR